MFINVGECGEELKEDLDHENINCTFIIDQSRNYHYQHHHE